LHVTVVVYSLLVILVALAALAIGEIRAARRGRGRPGPG
jgi:hypothetical protein